jgi:hypothetical protein
MVGRLIRKSRFANIWHVRQLFMTRTRSRHACLQSALKYLALIGDRAARTHHFARLIVEVANGHQVFEPAVEGGMVVVAPIVEVIGAVEAREVLSAAAELAAAREENRLAVTLMGLAGHYVGIINVEARELVQIIEGFQAGQLLTIIREDYEGIRTSGVSVPRNLMTMMRTLIGLADVSLLNRNGQYSESVTELEVIDLFPPTRETLHEYKERLLRAEGPLAEAIPRAVVHALKAYAETFKALPTEEAVARNQLKEKGDVLILLSAMLRVPQAIQKEALDLDNELQF